MSLGGKLTDIDREELAYLAGFFDGEGCICITKHKRPTKRGFEWRLTLLISNTNPIVLYRIHELFGGCRVKQVYPNKATKPAWQWQIWARGALRFLEALYPYLHLKKPEAETAIMFQRAKRGGGSHKTEKELALEEVQALLVRQLKTPQIKELGGY